MKSEFLCVNDISKWHDILDEIGSYDFYHLPEYHRLSETSGEGKSFLFVYHEESCIAAWPIILRNIATVPGLQCNGKDYNDATSVYGYPGPICNQSGRNNRGFLKRFQQEFINVVGQHSVVSVFSRLNPVLDNHQLFDDVEAITALNDTVIINLTESESDLISQYRKNYRNEIRKSHANGLECFIDSRWCNYEAFQDLYTATMKRVGAASEYYFPAEYFNGLREVLGNRLKLFVAKKGDHLCSGALFVLTNEIVQYHLSATDTCCGEPSAAKVIIDETRKWAKKEGAHYFHLGGGVNCLHDTLYDFKAGFSKYRRKYYLYKKIISPGIYNQLVKDRIDWYKQQGKIFDGGGYFPLYRSEHSVVNDCF
jgi:hypothetical protein